MEHPTLGYRPLNIGKSDICRLCMKTNEYYLNVFVSNEEFKMPIGKAIEDLLVLEVAKDDNLPKMVCCPCVTKLMEFRDFKVMCVNSAREFGRHAPLEPVTGAVKAEFLPMQSLGEATSEMWSNFVDGESRVPVAPNDLSLDPFALENQTDIKEEYPRDPLGEADDCGEEDFRETKFNEDDALCNGSKQLLIDDQGEVKKELELVGNGESQDNENNIGEGDSSDTGGPILLSDILAVMDMVNRCNNIGGLTEKPEKESDKFGVDRQGISQNHTLNCPSYDPVHEENLQLEYSMPNSFVVDGFPERMVKTQKKNVKFDAPIKEFSQLNDSGRPVRKHESEKFCHQAEYTSDPTEYICNYCNSRYSEKNSLALHIKIHVDGMRSTSILAKKDFLPRFSKIKLVKAFKCNECGKVFSTSGHLRRHSVVHSGVKPFKCIECGKMFSTSDHLRTHSVVHTGVKPFKCIECGKMFSLKSYLNKHSVVHTGVKRFQCKECGKMFTQKSNLNVHYVVHTGVRPFKCNFCCEQFRWRAGFKHHLLSHADGNPSR